MTLAVEAKNIVKNYGDFRAVDGVSFDIERGETFGILGENGAGKSTTMRMIACRSPLTGGELRVENLDVSVDERRIRSMLGIVPQENNLDPDLNVRENLMVYARYFRLGKSIALDRTKYLLDFVGLTSKSDAKVDALSGGMKRRLIIARALIHQPKILLLDEPTTGLDPNVRQEIWDKMEELRRTENLSIVISTHYMDEAEKLCRRLIIMADGRIIAAGSPRALIEKSVKKYALEIRQTESLPLQNVSRNLLAVKRGTAHLYFAETVDELTPLMRLYENRPTILRPANLEDVFLKLLAK